jgi:uncharacterized protein with ATP-grasp and redox domains
MTASDEVWNCQDTKREEYCALCVLTIRNSPNWRVERNEKQRKEIIDNLWSRINKQQGKKKKEIKRRRQPFCNWWNKVDSII